MDSAKVKESRNHWPYEPTIKKQTNKKTPKNSFSIKNYYIVNIQLQTLKYHKKQIAQGPLLHAKDVLEPEHLFYTDDDKWTMLETQEYYENLLPLHGRMLLS